MPSPFPGIDASRRRLVSTAAILVAAAGSRASPVRAADAAPYSSGNAAPRLSAPAGATDCHIHCYDARFPPAPTATLHPPDASPDDYAHLQKRLGIERAVVVQPSTYGTDNRCTLAALARFGSAARGVAVVDTSVGDGELERLARAGVRGIRFNLVQAGATTLDMVEPLSRRVEALGWHVQIHMKADQIAQAEALLLRLPSMLVIDHLGRVPPQDGLAHPGFRTVRKLLDAGRTWVKLSGAYQDSRVGGPSYADQGPVARAYVAAAPERLVWASDWPHPTEQKKPDDADLLDLLLDWAPDERVRTRILVDNPKALYGFASAR